MSLTRSDWVRHASVAGDFVLVRKLATSSSISDPDAGNSLQRLGSRSEIHGHNQVVTAAEDMSFWNDTAAKNLNLLFGFAALLLFLAALPRWIDFLAARRGKRSGWALSRKDRSPKAVGPLSSTSKETVKDKCRDVKVEVREAGSTTKPAIVPVGAFTARMRTIRSTYLLRSLPLPFSLLSHLSIGQLLVCVLYQSMVIFSLFNHCHDHSVNWKRSGFVAIAQLPAVFLAAAKNGIGTLLGTSYEKINFLHRVAGRLTILASLLHAVLFLRRSDWILRWDSDAQRTGAIGMIALCVMVISSFKIVRSTFYQFFLVCHVLGIVTFLVSVSMHAPEAARPYTVASLVNYGVDLFVRSWKTRPTLVSLAPLASEMTMIQSHSLKDGWRAGQHVFLRRWSWRSWHESHPFTIALSSSSESPVTSSSHKLTLLAKCTGGFTRAIHERALSSSAPIYCTIEGPYGHPLSLEFARFQSVMLYAGGTGTTFCASVFEELIGKARRGESRNRDITLIWFIRNLGCVEWYRSLITSLLRIVNVETSLSVSFFLHVTSTPDLPTTAPIPNARLSNCRPNFPAYLEHAISRMNYSLSHPDSNIGSKALSIVPTGGGLGVGVCGPRGLGTDARQAISRVEPSRALEVGGIVLHEETFDC